ncbi:MAG: hypothetical protein ABH842_03960 [Candidatus Micrarchaeota archaeon]
MVKTRIIKKQDKSYIELPSEMAKYDEVEIFSLKEGYYLISVPLGETHGSTSSTINEREKAVLKKLLSIKFENRTPPHISKVLDDDERNVLEDLGKKGLVNLFKGRKYVDGVYSIPTSTYTLVSGQSQQPNQPIGPIAVLNSRGFLIVNDKREAHTLSEKLSQEMKKGAFLGVKGFDNKFYIVSRDYFTSARVRIIDFLKQDSDIQSIVSTTKLDSDGCNAVLKIMAENGEIIEKKRGLYASV